MKNKGITIQFYRVREEDYECDLCCKNKAHISITFNRGYAIAICKECFESFGETKALFILEGVKKNRNLSDVKISREIWKQKRKMKSKEEENERAKEFLECLGNGKNIFEIEKEDET